MKNNNIKLLQNIYNQKKDFEDQNIEITISVQFPNMGKFKLSIKDTINYIKNKDKFSANYFGVSLKQWLEWKCYELGTCMAITRKGKPCRGYVDSYVKIKDFAQGNAGYCYIHSSLNKGGN